MPYPFGIDQVTLAWRFSASALGKKPERLSLELLGSAGLDEVLLHLGIGQDVAQADDGHAGLRRGVVHVHKVEGAEHDVVLAGNRDALGQRAVVVTRSAVIFIMREVPAPFAQATRILAFIVLSVSTRPRRVTPRASRASFLKEGAVGGPTAP